MASKNRKKKPLDIPSNLPGDIMREILTRLPVNSLLRFRSVSIGWNAVISSDQEFARAHLLKSKKLGNDERHLSQRQKKKYQDYFGLVDVEDVNEEKELVYTFPFKRNHNAQVMCSCDGLVVLRMMYNAVEFSYALWNPSIRMYTKFSSPDYFRGVHYLCYDPSTDDYKMLVLIPKGKKELEDVYWVIYSFRKDSWAEKREFPFPHIVGIMNLDANYNHGVQVEGSLYWLGRRRQNQKKKPPGNANYSGEQILVYFDSVDEKFKELPLPKYTRDFQAEDHSCNLLVVRGGLCIRRFNLNAKRTQIWMMKEPKDVNSWVVMMDVPVEIFSGSKLVSGQTLYVTQEGKVLLTDRQNQNTRIFNPKTNRISNYPCSDFMIIGFRESLIFPALPSKGRKKLRAHKDEMKREGKQQDASIIHPDRCSSAG